MSLVAEPGNGDAGPLCRAFSLDHLKIFLRVSKYLVSWETGTGLTVSHNAVHILKVSYPVRTTPKAITQTWPGWQSSLCHWGTAVPLGGAGLSLMNSDEVINTDTARFYLLIILIAGEVVRI